MTLYSRQQHMWGESETNNLKIPPHIAIQVGGYMNKKILTILSVLSIPIGALLLSACGPDMNSSNNDEVASDSAASDKLALESASSEFTSRGRALPGYFGRVGRISEWGRCQDSWDNDGNGRTDSADPACHILGPIHDLSIAGFPVGHNFNPDPRMIPKGGPGSVGGFRDRALIIRWLRFLTEPDGNVAGMNIIAPGVNNDLVPIPQPLTKKIHQGTFADGNNNNVSPLDLHQQFLEHNLAPKDGNVHDEYIPTYSNIYPKAGLFDVRGVLYKGGSQGAFVPTKLGNPDGARENKGRRHHRY